VKITKVTIWREQIPLVTPYAIASHQFDQVDLIYLMLDSDRGLQGFGCASPGTFVTGETPAMSFAALEQADDLLKGSPLSDYVSLLRRLRTTIGDCPAALAAVDMALHDLLAKFFDVPLVDLLGRSVAPLPTSITLGVDEPELTGERARAFVDQGFRVLKLKCDGMLEADEARINSVMQVLPEDGRLRLDPNQSYGFDDLVQLSRRIDLSRIDMFEQALPVGDKGQALLPEKLRRLSAADESLHNEQHALRLAQEPLAFGIFNIKLMKSGGLLAAQKIASLAEIAHIDLMWGCNDESCVSIAAALHLALACPSTQYLDLDGSFDLSRDALKGGFKLIDGHLMPLDKPGLGVELA